MKTSRRWRIFFGILILLLSLGFLIWGWIPVERVVQSLPLPTIQLPTPQSWLPELFKAI